MRRICGIALGAGCRNGQELWRAIQAQGYQGSAQPLYRLLGRWRVLPEAETEQGERSDRQAGKPATVPVRSPRQAAWLLQLAPTELNADNQAYLAEICRLCPELQTARTSAQAFVRMARERDQPGLEGWLAAVDESAIPELTGFVAGIRRDRDAVDAMLQVEWSNGQAEGQVNRLKVIKRQM